jgi:hypothetical protein
MALQYIKADVSRCHKVKVWGRGHIQNPFSTEWEGSGRGSRQGLLTPPQNTKHLGTGGVLEVAGQIALQRS